MDHRHADYDSAAITNSATPPFTNIIVTKYLNKMLREYVIQIFVLANDATKRARLEFVLGFLLKGQAVIVSIINFLLLVTR